MKKLTLLIAMLMAISGCDQTSEQTAPTPPWIPEGNLFIECTLDSYPKNIKWFSLSVDVVEISEGIRWLSENPINSARRTKNMVYSTKISIETFGSNNKVYNRLLLHRKDGRMEDPFDGSGKKTRTCTQYSVDELLDRKAKFNEQLMKDNKF